ncbi:MmyB family transcriptional regulator [Nocardia sp. NPDC004278]
MLSPRYDVLAHNKSYEALCPGFVRGERNVARRVFLTPECCTIIGMTCGAWSDTCVVRMRRIWVIRVGRISSLICVRRVRVSRLCGLVMMWRFRRVG